MKEHLSSLVLIACCLAVLCGCAEGTCVNLNENFELHVLNSKNARTIMIVEKHMQLRKSGWMGISLKPLTNSSSSAGLFKLIRTQANGVILPGRADFHIYSPRNLSESESFDTDRMVASAMRKAWYKNTYYEECYSFLKNSCLFALNVEKVHDWSKMEFVFYRNWNQTNFHRNKKAGTAVFQDPELIISGVLDISLVTPDTQCLNANVTRTNFSKVYYSMKMATSITLLLANSVAAIVLTLQLGLLSLFSKRILIRSRRSSPYLSAIFAVVGRIFAIACQVTVLVSLGGSVSKFSFTMFFIGPLFWLGTAFVLADSAASACSGVVYMVHIIRYFFVRDLYLMTQKQYRILGKRGGKLTTLYQRLASTKFSFVLGFMLAFLAVSIILPIIAFRRGSVGRLHQAKVLLVIIHVSIGAIAFLSFVCDILFNFKTVRTRGLRWHFQYSGTKNLKSIQQLTNFLPDPIYYRVEMLIGVVIFIVITLPFASTLFVLAKVMKDPLAKQILTSTVDIGIYIIDFINQYVLSAGGFATFIEIVTLIHRREFRTFITQRNEEDKPISKKQSDLIESIMQEDDTRKLMFEFSVHEFSTENISIWETLYSQKWKSNVTFEEFQEIYHTYIRTGAEMEVNIPSKTKKALQQLVNGPKHDIPFSQLENLYRDVLTNLSDTFSRLASTPEFKYKDSARKFQQNLLEHDYLISPTNMSAEYEQRQHSDT